MYYRFLEYVNQHQLFNSGHKLLLGVSGGVDSMVLAHLIDKAGFSYAITHCNFNLRGSESDGDQQLVAKMSEMLGVKFYLNSFQTKQYAADHRISIEMAARELRYNWFEQLCLEHGYHYIVVGHHLDDLLETFMLNLSRGTGIRGLSGIKAKAGRIVRPLLFATRSEIEEYSKLNNIEYRNDSSNSDVDIKRNKVRHNIIPLFEELNPSFKTNLRNTIDYLYQTEQVFQAVVAEKKQQIIQKKPEWVSICIDEINKLQPRSIWLFELLRDFGFNAETIEEIEMAIETPTGQLFYSAKNRLVIDRNQLIITDKEPNLPDQTFYLDQNQNLLTSPLSLKISTEPYNKNYKVPTQSNIAVLDFHQLQFPLLIRRWHKGEYFKPLGMSGFKKLSDFFIDEKLSLPEKESTWILASGIDVVWVIGKRIDDRFKLNTNTKMVYKIEWLNEQND